jgi:predicted secreted Zn-dependent protease
MRDMPAAAAKLRHESSILLKYKNAAPDIALAVAMPQAPAKFNLVASRMPFASRPARAALAILLSLATPGLAAAKVVYGQSISYFDIKGNTADELDAALNAQGPVAMGASSHHPGATRIRFGGEATYVPENGACRIGGARVTVNVEIILPRWRDRSHAGRQLSIVWDRLSADIRRHEEHHAAIARDHARMMERAILSLPPARDCDQLQARVDAESARAIEAQDRAQAQFDMTEAASFQNRIHRPTK